MNKTVQYTFYMLITVFVIGLKLMHVESLERAEWLLQDILYEFKSATPPSGKVTLVKIDDLSASELGSWPWSHEMIADLVAAVGAAEPSTVLLDVPAFGDAPEEKGKKSSKAKKKRSLREKFSLNHQDTTDIIAQQLFWMKNVTVSYEVLPSQVLSRDVTNPQYLFRHALKTNSDIGVLDYENALTVRNTLLPNDQISDAARHLGFSYTHLDDDQTLRSEPLVMNFEGYYYPSATLAAAAHFLHVNLESITVNGGESIELPGRTIPTNHRGEMLLNFPTGYLNFKSISAGDILNQRVDFSSLKNQLVVITLTTGAQTEYYNSPVSPELPRYLKTAVAIDNILEKTYLHRADSHLVVYIFILILVGALCAIGLPLIAANYRIAVVALALVMLLNANYFLFNTMNLMANSVFIAVQLLLFLVASPLLSLDYSFVGRLINKVLRKDDEDELIEKVQRVRRLRETRELKEVTERRSEEADVIHPTSVIPSGIIAGITENADAAATLVIQNGDAEDEHSKTVISSDMVAANETAAISDESETAAISGATDSETDSNDKGGSDDNGVPIETYVDYASETDYGVISNADLDASVNADDLSETGMDDTPAPANSDLIEVDASAGSKSEISDSSSDEADGSDEELAPALGGDDSVSAADEIGANEKQDESLFDQDQDQEQDQEQEPEPEADNQAVEEKPALAQTPNPNSVLPGQKLGRYELQSILGKGAMGTVFRGVDPAINRPVALKTIRLDFLTDEDEIEEMKKRLFLEAQAAGKMSHPNIVTIYDVGSEGSVQYIAMECIEGRTLEEMIKKKVNFNFKIIGKIIYQICSALQYAHDQGIVHRDVKPANIMILPDYSVKVMDFGIARVESTSLTKTGIAMGTPNYISPEQLQGKPVDGRTDIFSLGIVIYEMLIGERPFKGENLTNLIYNIVNAEPELPSKTNPRIPPLFDNICQKALQKDPQLRFQKAGDIAVMVNQFVQSFASR